MAPCRVRVTSESNQINPTSLYIPLTRMWKPETPRKKTKQIWPKNKEHKRKRETGKTRTNGSTAGLCLFPPKASSNPRHLRIALGLGIKPSTLLDCGWRERPTASYGGKRRHTGKARDPSHRPQNAHRSCETKGFPFIGLLFPGRVPAYPTFSLYFSPPSPDPSPSVSP